MTRAKQNTRDETTSTPEGAKAPRPPQTDLDAYDRQLKKVFDFQALTSASGWSDFFGGLLSDLVVATKALKSCEKMTDVIRCQATIALVENQLARLRQPAEDLNAMRGRWPLFFQDHPYRADFDELTGHVTVIHLGEDPGNGFTTPVGHSSPKLPASVDEGEDEPGEPEPEPGDPFDD